MSEMKDWRGTPITVGAKVVAHGKGDFPIRSLSIVTKVHDSGTVTIDPIESDSSWRGKKKYVIGTNSVTVLTKDMLDDS